MAITPTGGSLRNGSGGAQAVDPVCGRAVEVARCALRAVVGGRVFYLCSAPCKDAFDRAPFRFVAPEDRATAR